jgi:hypothetical protein
MHTIYYKGQKDDDTKNFIVYLIRHSVHINGGGQYHGEK